MLSDFSPVGIPDDAMAEMHDDNHRNDAAITADELEAMDRPGIDLSEYVAAQLARERLLKPSTLAKLARAKATRAKRYGSFVRGMIAQQAKADRRRAKLQRKAV